MFQIFYNVNVNQANSMLSEEIEVNIAENFVLITSPNIGNDYSPLITLHDYNTVSMFVLAVITIA